MCTFKVKYYYNNQKNITNDRFILAIVNYSLKIAFKNKPQLVNVPKIPHNVQAKSIINLEVNNLLKKEFFTKCPNGQDDFISTILTKEKKNGTFETILNLKYLDGFVEYKHFKMESLEDAFKIIKEDGWMANVDLKDAFFTILVHILYQKYFKFESFNQFYKFLGMQNGHSNAIRVFTENFKTSLWILSDCNWTRTQNHLVCKRTLNHLAKLAT